MRRLVAIIVLLSLGLAAAPSGLCAAIMAPHGEDGAMPGDTHELRGSPEQHEGHASHDGHASHAAHAGHMSQQSHRDVGPAVSTAAGEHAGAPRAPDRHHDGDCAVMMHCQTMAVPVPADRVVAPGAVTGGDAVVSGDRWLSAHAPTDTPPPKVSR